MPTTYPKCTPTELMGLLVLLKDHHDADDLARLADDLDLEIDEILPSSDWAEALGLVSVQDGRVSFTEVGRRLVASSIRERKNLLREQLRLTTLYTALLSALEKAPGGKLTEEEANRLIAFTAAPADDAVLNIINWGRYAELFRYDPGAHILTLVRHRGPRSPGGAGGLLPPDSTAEGRLGDAPVSPASSGTEPAVRLGSVLS